MKKQIRSNVFETNSSSVHTLTISTEGREPSTFKLNNEGKIEVDFGSFTNECKIYSSQYDKLSYLITCLYYLAGYDVDNIYDNLKFSYLEDAICKYTGATGIKIINKNEPYIDHQSIPYYDIELVNVYDEEAVINFVFNKFISLKTDSD